MDENLDLELYKLINTDLLFTNDDDYYKHYSEYGKNEKRLKSYNDFILLYPNFNVKEYKDLNSDLQSYSQNQLIAHYHNFGKNENRIISINNFYDIYPEFNIKLYKLFNSDIKQFKDIEIYSHYIMHGNNEDRISTIKDFNIKYPLFNLEFYKNMYDKNKLSDIDIIYDYYKNLELIEKINNYLLKNNIILDNIPILKKNNKIYQISNIDLFYSFYPDFNIELYKLYLKKQNVNYINYSDIEIIIDFFKSSEFYINDYLDIFNKLLITKKIKLKNIMIDSSVIYSLSTFYKNYSQFNYYRYFKYINADSIKAGLFEENKGENEIIIDAYKNIENLSKIFFEKELNDIEEINDIDINDNKNINDNKISEYLLKYQQIILKKNKSETVENYKNDDKKILKDIEDLGLKNKIKDIVIYTNIKFNLNNQEICNQYYFANLLNKNGFRVRIYNDIEYKKNNIFSNYYFDDLDFNNLIIIYCNSENKKIINSKSEIKLIFNKPNISTDNSYLSLIYLSPNIKTIDTIHPRSGFCYINNYNKEYNPLIKLLHPSNSIEINNETTEENYINIFNKCVFFISYEPSSFLSFISVLCGCICIVHPVENMSKKEWLETTLLSNYIKNNNLDNIYGIAYGINDLDYAKNTLHLARDQWNNIIKFNIETSFTKFINYINSI